MKKLILTPILACLMLVLNSLSAMAQEPVKWTASYKMTSDTEGIVTLTAEIADGWHMYGLKLPDVGPSATKLAFSCKGCAFDGGAKMRPAPKKEFDSMFEAELSYWEKGVTFTRKFKVTNPEAAEVTVSVTYMCCNDSSCRPPKTQDFTLKIK